MNKKKFKAFIFDMDGTIIDSEKIWTRVNKEFLKNKGITDLKIINNVLEEITGHSSEKIAEIFKRKFHLPDTISSIIKEKKIIASNLFSECIDFIPGFIEFHNALKKKNIPTAIATNAPREFLDKIAETLSLKKYFLNHMYCITCVNNICKPCPDVYLHAAKQLQVDPQECVAIEDSSPGVESVKNAGMYCIGINTSNDRTRLKKADIIVNSYEEINLDIFI